MDSLENLTQICQYLADRPNRFATVGQLRHKFPGSQIYEPTSKLRHELLRKHKIILLLWHRQYLAQIQGDRSGWQLKADWQQSLEQIARSPLPTDLVLGDYQAMPNSTDLVLSPYQTGLFPLAGGALDQARVRH